MNVNNNKLSYYDLQKMELVLWGEEKIRLDAADFFGDLNIVDSLPFDGNLNSENGKCIVICSFSPEPYIEKLKAKGLKFITINDMISTTDEIELYNNAVNHPTKKIIILGEDKGLIAQNPNIKIDYALDNINDKLKNERSGDIRIICTMEPNKTTRTELNNLGFVFGKDFYFHYNGSKRSHLPSPSQLLRKTMQEKPKYNIGCKINYHTAGVAINEIFNCWRNHTNFIFLESLAYVDVQNMVYSVFYRILQLSTANKTYSFCASECPKIGDKNLLVQKGETLQREKYRLLKPQEYTWSINHDYSCNLKCITCRLHHLTSVDKIDEDIVEIIHRTIIENIDLMPILIFGDGEMFYGKYNRDILFDKNPHKELSIATNGTLFNEENWQKLRIKYNRIKNVNVSVDAASKETYKYVRGADFDMLLKNLRMLSELRKAGEIETFCINFTIGTFNFREMKDFIKLARELSCDYCEFHKIRCWSVFKKEELSQVDVYDENNEHHVEFLEIISDPIFMSSDVSISDKRGIEHLFNNNKEKEIKSCQ